MEKSNQIKRTYYEEAMRYIENAEDTFKKSPIIKGVYTDKKYVKSAGGIVYAGIEIAAKWYIKLHGVSLANNADSAQITKKLSHINKKVLELYNRLYTYFHVAVYYNAHDDVDMIKKSMLSAKEFMAYLKPYDKQVVYGRGGKLVVKIPKDK